MNDMEVGGASRIVDSEVIRDGASCLDMQKRNMENRNQDDRAQIQTHVPPDADSKVETKAIRVLFPTGPLLIFACGNHAGRCRWSSGFLGYLPFPRPCIPTQFVPTTGVTRLKEYMASTSSLSQKRSFQVMEGDVHPANRQFFDYPNIKTRRGSKRVAVGDALDQHLCDTFRSHKHDLSAKCRQIVGPIPVLPATVVSMPEDNGVMSFLDRFQAVRKRQWPATQHRNDIQPSQARHRSDIQPSQAWHRRDIQPQAQCRNDMQPSQGRHSSDIQPSQARHRNDIQLSQARHSANRSAAEKRSRLKQLVKTVHFERETTAIGTRSKRSMRGGGTTIMTAQADSSSVLVGGSELRITYSLRPSDETFPAFLKTCNDGTTWRCPCIVHFKATSSFPSLDSNLHVALNFDVGNHGGYLMVTHNALLSFERTLVLCVLYFALEIIFVHLPVSATVYKEVKLKTSFRRSRILLQMTTSIPKFAKVSVAPECKGGETGDPRDNPSTSGNVRHNPHLRKSGSDPIRNYSPPIVTNFTGRMSLRAPFKIYAEAVTENLIATLLLCILAYCYVSLVCVADLGPLRASERKRRPKYVSRGAMNLPDGQGERYKMVDDEREEKRAAREVACRRKICDCEHQSSDECDCGVDYKEVWATLNIEILRADEGEEPECRVGRNRRSRENSLTSDIVQHDSLMWKSGCDLAGNRTRFILTIFFRLAQNQYIRVAKRVGHKFAPTTIISANRRGPPPAPRACAAPTQGHGRIVVVYLQLNEITRISIVFFVTTLHYRYGSPGECYITVSDLVMLFTINGKHFVLHSEGSRFESRFSHPGFRFSIVPPKSLETNLKATVLLLESMAESLLVPTFLKNSLCLLRHGCRWYRNAIKDVKPWSEGTDLHEVNSRLEMGPFAIGSEVAGNVFGYRTFPKTKSECTRAHWTAKVVNGDTVVLKFIVKEGHSADAAVCHGGSKIAKFPVYPEDLRADLAFAFAGVKCNGHLEKRVERRAPAQPGTSLFRYTQYVRKLYYSEMMQNVEKSILQGGHVVRLAHSGFAQVGIVPDSAAAGWRVSSGISRSPSPCIPALQYSHLTSPSSALKTSLLRADQISHLTPHFNFKWKCLHGQQVPPFYRKSYPPADWPQRSVPRAVKPNNAIVFQPGFVTMRLKSSPCGQISRVFRLRSPFVVSALAGLNYVQTDPSLRRSSLPVAIGCCLLEKSFSYLTGPLRIRQLRHGSYVIRVRNQVGELEIVLTDAGERSYLHIQNVRKLNVQTAVVMEAIYPQYVPNGRMGHAHLARCGARASGGHVVDVLTYHLLKPNSEQHPAFRMVQVVGILLSLHPASLPLIMGLSKTASVVLTAVSYVFSTSLLLTNHAWPDPCFSRHKHFSENTTYIRHTKSASKHKVSSKGLHIFGKRRAGWDNDVISCSAEWHSTCANKNTDELYISVGQSATEKYPAALTDNSSRADLVLAAGGRLSPADRCLRESGSFRAEGREGHCAGGTVRMPDFVEDWLCARKLPRVGTEQARFSAALTATARVHGDSTKFRGGRETSLWKFHNECFAQFTAASSLNCEGSLVLGAVLPHFHK
ncbi:hypothetical protein PR048_008314 [Dryococelus australis]|uniref:Uncharacterized protein n=1 Tax=Dryococelus australis TaxID=614101 RepID=A0ABQ9HXP3_9NEOP|nr:hypothetical protein PR048_008314 [Dryococelus australis]